MPERVVDMAAAAVARMRQLAEASRDPHQLAAVRLNAWPGIAVGFTVLALNPILLPTHAVLLH